MSTRSYAVTVALAAIATVAIWNLPFGRFVLYPFTILATWVHEMGHGMAGALLTRFEHLVLNSDGSGYARVGQGGRLTNAAIAAAGLLGPAVAGALIILFGRNPKRAGLILGGLAAAMALSALLYVRSAFGFVAVGLWAAALGACALKLREELQYFLVQFLGLQFCINNFRDFDYMFSRGFHSTRGWMASDTQMMADNLFLPFWVWGALVAVSSIGLLVGALMLVHKLGERPSLKRSPNPDAAGGAGDLLSELDS